MQRKTKAERREQQDLEVEESDSRMRANIAEMDRLIGDTKKMLERHRDERDADDVEQGEDGN